MKIRAWVLGLAVAAALLPAAAPAQVEIRRYEREDARAGSGWMGIQFQWEGADAREARVRDVVDGSPAERAGIRGGDVIVRINGQPATEAVVDRLREELDEGESVRLTVRRDGREEERTVVAGKRPERVVIRGGPDIIDGGPGVVRIPEGGERIIIRMDTLRAHMDSLLRHVDSLRIGLRRRGGDSVVIHVDTVVSILRDSLVRAFPRDLPRVFGEGGMGAFFHEFGPRSLAGAEFAEMNEGLGRYFRTSEGLLVLQVAPESPAARAGLESGDVVVQADGQAVEELSDLREAFAKAEDRQVRLTVLRQGARRQIELRWEGREFRRFRIEDRVRAREERGTEE